MPSATFNITASGDDGRWAQSGSQSWATNENGFWIGNVFGNGLYNFFVFSSISIPPGSIITNAFVRLYGNINDDNGDTVNIDVKLGTYDNAIAPTTYDQAVALSLSSPVLWSAVPHLMSGESTDSPDISLLLQAVIDRGGWASGNAILVFMGLATGCTAYRMIRTYEHGSDSAELHVTWTVPEFGAFDLLASEFRVAWPEQFKSLASDFLIQGGVFSELPADFRLALETLCILRSEFSIGSGEAFTGVYAEFLMSDGNAFSGVSSEFWILKPIPAFAASTMQRLSSVLSEVS